MSSAGYRCSAVALQAELTPRANLSCARGQTSVLSLDERGDPLWRQRQRPNGDTERIGNGVRDAPGLLAGGWHWIIGKGPRQEPAVVTVSEHLVERSTSAVREIRRALGRRRAQGSGTARIVHRHVFVGVNLSGVAVHLDTAEIENETAGGRSFDLIGFVQHAEPRQRPGTRSRAVPWHRHLNRSCVLMARPGERAGGDRVIRIGRAKILPFANRASSEPRLSWEAATQVGLSRIRSAAKCAAPPTAPIMSQRKPSRKTIPEPRVASRW